TTCQGSIFPTVATLNAALPAAEIAWQRDTTGEGTRIVDNTTKIQAAIAANNKKFPTEEMLFPTPTSVTGGAGSLGTGGVGGSGAGGGSGGTGPATGGGTRGGTGARGTVGQIDGLGPRASGGGGCGCRVGGGGTGDLAALVLGAACALTLRTR